MAEDSITRTIPIADLLANDSKGAANESGQTLTFTGIVPGSAVGGTAVVSGSNILFTPAADYFGTAGFKYTVSDNGTTNGDPDPKTGTGQVSFTVTSVNDVPVAAGDASATFVGRGRHHQRGGQRQGLGRPTRTRP